MTMEFDLGERARSMRCNPTEPEKRLWRSLSNSQLGGFKFRRQAVISPYIVDFLCPAKALIVEVDGDTHTASSDRKRDLALSAKGYRMPRFINADVMRHCDGVLLSILQELEIASDRWSGRPHPNPSPKGEGLAIPRATS